MLSCQGRSDGDGHQVETEEAALHEKPNDHHDDVVNNCFGIRLVQCTKVDVS